jgi:hypothetical protein
MTYNYARKENEGIFWPAESYLRAYIVEVSSPRVIKLNDPAPFAYLINIVPQLDPANTVINDGPSKIRLNSVNLSLQNRVHFCATSGSGPQISDHYFVQHFELGKVFQSSVDFPILSNNSEYHEVNIGNSFQLSLAPCGPYARDDYIEYLPRFIMTSSRTMLSLPTHCSGDYQSQWLRKPRSFKIAPLYQFWRHPEYEYCTCQVEYLLPEYTRDHVLTHIRVVVLIEHKESFNLFRRKTVHQ